MSTRPLLKSINFLPKLTIQEYERYLPNAYDENLSILQKMNKIIEYLHETGRITNELIKQWQELMEWILSDGLEEAVENVLNQWYENGKLNEIFQRLFDFLLDRPANIKQYGGVGDGVHDDTEAFLKAASVKGQVWLPKPDVAWIINNAVWDKGDLFIDAELGTVIKTTANNPAIHIKGKYEEAYPINSITVGSHPNFSSATVSVLQMSTNPPYVIGDVIKIYSEDLLHSSTTTKKGEFASVIGVYDNKVYLSGTLRHQYYTTPMVRRLSKINNTFSINNVMFDTSDVYQNKQAYMQIDNSFQPKVTNCGTIKGGSKFIEMKNCFAYRINNLDVKNLQNNPATGNLGYGVSDRGSYKGVVSDSTFINVRHGFTTVENDYGDTFFPRIVNCAGIGCTNAPFDTHTEAYGVTFDGCTTEGSIQGNDSLGAGFQSRSPETSIINCSSDRDLFGIYLFSKAINNKIINTTVRDSTYRPLMIMGGNDRLTNTQVKDSFFSSKLTGNEVMKFQNADILFENVKAILGATSANYCRIINMENTILTAKNLMMDCRQYLGSSFRFIHLVSSECYLTEVELKKGNVTFTNIFTGDESTTNKLRAITLTTDSTNVNTFGIQDVRIDSEGLTTAIQEQTFGQDGLSLLYPLELTASKFVYVPVNPILPNLNIGGFRKGFSVGQIILIKNVSNENDIGVVSSQYVNVPANFRIPPNGAHAFYWNGGAFHPA